MTETRETKSNVVPDMFNPVVGMKEDKERGRANNEAVTRWENAIRANDPDYRTIEPIMVAETAKLLFLERLVPKTPEDAVTMVQRVYDMIRQRMQGAEEVPVNPSPVSTI